VASGKLNGFQVVRLETHTENEERISSTLIRNCLTEGKLQLANHLLGYHYFVEGTVVSGNRIGNTIGFPTANVNCLQDFKQIPSDGVYAVTVDRKGKSYLGMLEVHLFDVSDDLYNETLTVRFVERIRDEMKFGSLNELKAQLEQDSVNSKRILNRNNN
jgi:riboflavin kinase/FMN adenylyltransferase